MSVKRFTITLILFAALVLPAGAPPALAQPAAPSPTAGGSWLPASADVAPRGPVNSLPTSPSGAAPLGALQSPEGDWIMPADAGGRSPDAPLGAAVQPAGGPDDFGYTFASTPLNWIDASGGINTGISASVDSAGPIDIGFPFKYYENTYSQLWVSRFGFLAFNNSYLYRSQSRIPEPSLPNDVIAPHWIPSYDSPNYVRYLRGGTAPNRWFVMEWNRQRSDCCSPDPTADEFTFQAVLYENGDILFQYQDMRIYGGYYCQASGIEDSTGIDGLSITDFCRPVASNQAVRITRPAPAARVRIFPQHYGSFFYPGETTLTQLPIRNTGELGADVYDLTLDSPWLALLVHEDGATPLTDTDGDGVVDTGPVLQGHTKTIGVRVWSSPGTQVGYHNTATVTARSSLDPARYKTATSRIAVPASFAQVFGDDADGAMSMMLVKPQAQAVRKATSDWHWGSNVAVAELPNHNLIYVWSKGRCVDSNCTRYTSEIEYTILNPYGETVRPIARLTDNSGASFSTYDYPSGVAVAPDGRVGLIWYRYLWNSSNSQSNYNIYWAALDATGNLAVGPTNVTNNSVWGSSSALNVPRFYNPVIAATDNGRFVLAWESEQRETAGWVENTWYAVLDSSGGMVRSPTQLTDASAGSNRWYVYPSLTQLSGNRVLMAYSGYVSPTLDIYYVVLDSDGSIQRGITKLTNNGPWEYRPDAIQLANGRVVLGWSSYQSGAYRARFAVMDNAYNVISGPTTLANPAALFGDFFVSVTSSGDYLGVLTWMDNNYSYRRNLYYALVDANGAMVTPPIIFQTSQATSPSIFSSYTGYGNTTYSWTPPAGVDSALSATPAIGYAAPGGMATSVEVRLQGRGGVPATSVRLTATLDPRLNYVDDTSGVTPTVSGQTVTWNLPNLRLYDIRQFQVNTRATGGSLGDSLPVQLQLTSAEPDLTPTDNQATVQVRLSRPLYLPLLIRQ